MDCVDCRMAPAGRAGYCNTCMLRRSQAELARKQRELLEAESRRAERRFKENQERLEAAGREQLLASLRSSRWEPELWTPVELADHTLGEACLRLFTGVVFGGSLTAAGLWMMDGVGGFWMWVTLAGLVWLLLTLLVRGGEVRSALAEYRARCAEAIRVTPVGLPSTSRSNGRGGRHGA